MQRFWPQRVSLTGLTLTYHCPLELAPWRGNREPELPSSFVPKTNTVLKQDSNFSKKLKEKSQRKSSSESLPQTDCDLGPPLGMGRNRFASGKHHSANVLFIRLTELTVVKHLESLGWNQSCKRTMQPAVYLWRCQNGKVIVLVPEGLIASAREAVTPRHPSKKACAPSW